jgi:hypothetical protein
VAGIERIQAFVLKPGDEPLTLFRVCRVPEGDPELIESFTSSYESNRPPRGWEERNVLIHMGLSMFVRKGQAEETARRFPVIGEHVACVSLRHGHGFAYARTGSTGHMTIWGRPLQLVAGVAEITPIDF